MVALYQNTQCIPCIKIHSLKVYPLSRYTACTLHHTVEKSIPCITPPPCRCCCCWTQPEAAARSVTRAGRCCCCCRGAKAAAAAAAVPPPAGALLGPGWIGEGGPLLAAAPPLSCCTALSTPSSTSCTTPSTYLPNVGGYFVPKYTYYCQYHKKQQHDNFSKWNVCQIPMSLI